MKLILGIGVALLVALGVGWAWGASGRSDITRALRIAELRGGLLEGRAAVLDARLDIYSVNFGDASRHLEAGGAACYRTRRKATRSFFSCAVRWSCWIRLKYSTVSSRVRHRPSCR